MYLLTLFCTMIHNEQLIGQHIRSFLRINAIRYRPFCVKQLALAGIYITLRGENSFIWIDRFCPLTMRFK